MNKTENMNRVDEKALSVDVAEENFGAEVLDSKQPVLVEFWAPWSRPCQILDAVLEEIAAAVAGKAKVVKINADNTLELSLRYYVQYIPTLLLFVEGKPCFRIVGTASKEAILARLKPFGILDKTSPTG